MLDPRSLALSEDRWLTDSRVYSIIWMGRWLERAENLTRALDAAALSVLNHPTSEGSLPQLLCAISAAWGLPADPEPKLETLLLSQSSPSIYHSLVNARNNAQPVAPLELINALNALVLKLDELDLKASTPAEVHQLATEILGSIASAADVIEKRWFRQESLSEEEVYHRFLQQ